METATCQVCNEGKLLSFPFKEQSVGDLSAKNVYACSNPKCGHIIQVRWAEGRGYHKNHIGLE